MEITRANLVALARSWLSPHLKGMSLPTEGPDSDNFNTGNGDDDVLGILLFLYKNAPLTQSS